MPVNPALLKPLTVPLQTAFQLLGVGKTKGGLLVQDGTIKTVRIGNRPMAIYAELEAMVRGDAA